MTRKEAIEILGLNINFSEKELKKAYRKLMMENHPDLNKEKDNSNEISSKINEAYSILKNNSHKREYKKEPSFNFDETKNVVLNKMNKEFNILNNAFKNETNDMFLSTFIKYNSKFLVELVNLKENIKKSETENSLRTYVSDYYKIKTTINKELLGELLELLKNNKSFNELYNDCLENEFNILFKNYSDNIKVSTLDIRKRLQKNYNKLLRKTKRRFLYGTKDKIHEFFEGKTNSTKK